jgi:hypothetical protein
VREPLAAKAEPGAAVAARVELAVLSAVEWVMEAAVRAGEREQGWACVAWPKMGRLAQRRPLRPRLEGG